MAQAFFEKVKDELAPALPYQAHSAGISAIEGINPTKEAIFCMDKHGMDITNHQAKLVEQNIINHSACILTMTKQQKMILKINFPQASQKIFLLRPFCLQSNHIINKEVEDPFGKSMLFYENICYQLEQDIKKLIYRLREG